MQDPVHLARELARIARQNQLAEIEYRSDPLRLRLIFEEKLQPATMTTSQPAGVYASLAPDAQLVEEPASPVAPANPVIRSPLAGVFYQAPRPGAPFFVELAQPISTGHTLCIVEAMKLMNEITAESPMKIVKVLVQNATVVESGQALFEYEPLG
jgi:acetyl-CoA carboxylase biotin carboxyl carrier protein